MHSEYLRSCYVGNEFARGEFEVDGRRLDPSAVEVDSYVLAAVDDHIVPWTSGYRTTQVLGGKHRFVLSTSGHIAGIVNPPSPKAKHWTNDALPADAQEWKADAELNEGTWWNDWTTWIAERGGELVPAPAQLGSDAHPVLEAAPGPVRPRLRVRLASGCGVHRLHNHSRVLSCGDAAHGRRSRVHPHQGSSTDSSVSAHPAAARMGADILPVGEPTRPRRAARRMTIAHSVTGLE